MVRERGYGSINVIDEDLKGILFDVVAYFFVGDHRLK